MVQNIYLSNYTTVFEPGCQILYGPHAAAGHLLSITAEISVEQPLHLLDFGNRCDMYYTARQLRYLTRDPAAAMQNIRLQRAFTCYQALALLHQISSFECGLPVIILDLLAPYLDENIKTAEIYRLFSESVELLRSVMRERMILIGVKPVPVKLAPDRVCLVNSLARTFGLIPVDMEPVGGQLSEAGYQQRPVSRAWGSEKVSSARKNKPELMARQPTLFDDEPFRTRDSENRSCGLTKR